jgi:hypothetical protein
MAAESSVRKATLADAPRLAQPLASAFQGDPGALRLLSKGLALLLFRVWSRRGDPGELGFGVDLVKQGEPVVAAQWVRSGRRPPWARTSHPAKLARWRLPPAGARRPSAVSLQEPR